MNAPLTCDECGATMTYCATHEVWSCACGAEIDAPIERPYWGGGA